MNLRNPSNTRKPDFFLSFNAITSDVTTPLFFGSHNKQKVATWMVISSHAMTKIDLKLLTSL